jgi:hypothetical protein
MTTTNFATAADLVHDRLARYVNDVGWPGPLPTELVAVARAPFGHPLDVRRYLVNSLNPGGFPLEVSFAEAEPSALRLDVQPFDLSPADGAATALQLAGVQAAEVAQWRSVIRPRHFGGFVGVAASIGRSVMKAYLELDRDAATDELTHPVRRHAQRLAGYIPWLRPHLVALGDPAGARLYFEAEAGVALLDLFDWAPTAAMMAQVPAVIDAARQLTGGSLVLPPRSALLSLRPVAGDPDGVELKVELTRQALVADAADVVERLLIDRPVAQAMFRCWRAALSPVSELSVVSLRIAPGQAGPGINAYGGLIDDGVFSVGNMTSYRLSAVVG